MENNASVQGLIEWQSEAESMYASQAGPGIRKKVCCTCTGKFKVYDQDECIYHGTDPFMAMEKYHSIRRTIGS